MRTSTIPIAILAAIGLAGCDPATDKPSMVAAEQTAGQLFCSFQIQGGGSFVAGLVNTAATAADPALGIGVVIATGATKAYVDERCRQAVASVNGAVSAAPVSPPANPSSAAQVAVVAPPPPDSTQPPKPPNTP